MTRVTAHRATLADVVGQEATRSRSGNFSRAVGSARGEHAVVTTHQKETPPRGGVGPRMLSLGMYTAMVNEECPGCQ